MVEGPLLQSSELPGTGVALVRVEGILDLGQNRFTNDETRVPLRVL